MKKGFFSSNKASAPAAKQLKPAPLPSPAPSAPSSRPSAFHTSPVNSSTLSWSFLPPTATPSTPTATSALLLTSLATSRIQSLSPPPISSLPSVPIWTISPIPKKGLGIVALVDIPRGTTLFRESPLIVYDERRGVEEKDKEMVMRYALSHLRKEVQATVLELSNVFAGPEDVLVGILRTNAYPLVQFEGDGVSYHALFELFSRLNHSCDPNVLPAWDETTFSVAVQTTKDVKKGQELLTTYIVPFQKRKERRSELLLKYKFECHCDWCDLDDIASAKKDEERERLAAAFLKQWDDGS